MSKITGKHQLARKQCLADLLIAQLKKTGAEAQIVKNQINSMGFKDMLAVGSSIGLIHVSGSEAVGDDKRVEFGGRVSSELKHLADKTYFCAGWNTGTGVTRIVLVKIDQLVGKGSLKRTAFMSLAESHYLFEV